MFGNGSNNETVATASNGGLAIGKMGDGNIVLQNPTFPTEIKCPIPSNFFALCERGQKVDSKIDLQIDKVKEFINSGQIQSALKKIREIEEIWKEDLTNHHKFRLATNSGVICAIQNDYHCAADKFIEAFNWEQNETTYANKILAYILLKDNAKLDKTITEAQKAFPNSKVVTGQIIKSYIHDSSIRDLHNIDDVIYTESICCLMASSFYAERDDFENAVVMAQKANDIKPNDWQIMANLGCCLIAEIFLKRINYSLLTDEQFNNMQRAQSLFEESWNIVKNSEYPFDFISYIPINLFSLYSLQQNREKADKLLEILYDKLPDNSNIVFQKIIRNLNNINDDDLLKLQPNIYNDHAKLLAELCLNKGEYENALRYILQAPNKDDIFIITMHIHCLKNLHNNAEISKIKKHYKDKTIKAIIEFIETNNPDVLLKVKNSTKRNDLKLYMAQSLYGCSKYMDASDVFRSVICHKDLRDVFYRQYLSCLAQTKQLYELKKELSRFSRENMDDWALELLGYTYAEMSNIEDAENIFNTLYELHPNNANYICNLLIALIKLNEKSKAIDVLNRIDRDIYKLDGEIRYKHGIILYINDYIDQRKALEQIYLLTINNITNVEVWNQYLYFIINKNIEDNCRTAYLLQDTVSQSSKCIFIDDNIVSETKYFDIIPVKNPMAEVLLSHKQGDIIDISPSVKAEIKNIDSKYLALSQIIYANIFLEFPDNKQIERISANSPEEFLSYFRSISDEQKKHWSVCQDIYDKGLPIPLLAGLIGKDVFSVIRTLQLSHLNIARGLPGEIEKVVKLCTKQDRYIIDACTLYNIYVFQLQNILIPLQNKIYIAQGTKDKFVSVIEEYKNSINSQSSRIQIDPETGQIYMITPEQLNHFASINLRYFEEALRWMQNKAVIVKAKYEAEFNDEQKKVLSKFSECDKEVSEIIDIATERNLILISDDLHLRDWSQIFGVRSVWIQAMLKMQQVPQDVYNNYLKAAICRHHTFVSLTAQDLIYSLCNDSTQDMGEFRSLVNRLGYSSTDSAARVIQETLACIRSKYSKYSKLYVYNIIINAYLQNGTSTDFEERLEKLYFLGDMYPRFMEALYLWLQGHFITY